MLERLAEEKEKLLQEKSRLRLKQEETQAKIDQLGSDVGNKAEVERLKMVNENLGKDLKNVEKEGIAIQKQMHAKKGLAQKEERQRAALSAKKGERNFLEKQLNETKTLGELDEQIAELQRQNAEDEALIFDEAASISDKEGARERIEERDEEITLFPFAKG